MALQEYITVDDFNHRLFNRFSPEYRQKFIDEANDELEDLAKKKGVQPENISVPIHRVLKKYAVEFAKTEFADANIGSNSGDGVLSGEDKYKDLYFRARARKQDIHQRVTRVMFTGDVETIANRAVTSQRIMRGYSPQSNESYIEEAFDDIK